MKVLIAGCGYVGQRLAERLRAAGHDVTGLTHSPESAAAVGGVACDISDAAGVAALPRVDAVIHCAASGRGGGPERYRQVYVEGIRNLVAAQAQARFVFTSSTSVYPQTDGSVVTEESPADPPRESGRLLREAEDLALTAGGAVVRLAGLYGPGRSVLLKQFLLGEAQIDVRTEPPLTPDGRWINQIHRHDAASALAWVLERGLRGVFNACDLSPMTQRQIYAQLATRFARPLPPEGPPAADRKRGWTHKRVSCAKLAATGWEPRFPSWFHALETDPELVPSVLDQLETGRG